MILRGSRPTKLELVVLKRIAAGTDPWGGVHGVGSRKCSGAIGRLKKRGMIEVDYETAIGFRVTEFGAASLR